MKIVVLDRATMGFDIPFEKLSNCGELVIYESCKPSDVSRFASDAQVLILNKVKLTREILLNLPNLKLICVFATGYDNVDIDSARDLGIAVCNAPGYSRDSVTLFTFATALSLITKLNQYNDFIKSGEYSASGFPNKIEPTYNDLRGKVWGIIGLGSIGKSVADIAKAFGAELLCYTRTENPMYNCVDLNTLCEKSDIISIHCPLTHKTRNMINGEKIKLMKKNVIIINEARGAIVSESDIADAVLCGKISGYGCDVYSEEPFSVSHPYNKIKDLKNVILTPHSAWASFEARVRCLDIIISNIQSFLSGEKLNRVDLKN